MCASKNSSHTTREQAPFFLKSLMENTKVNMKGLFVFNKQDTAKLDYGLYEMPSTLNRKTGDFPACRLKKKMAIPDWMQVEKYPQITKSNISRVSNSSK
jgi:hypothetical protein